jgi:hypothetical protein
MGVDKQDCVEDEDDRGIDAQRAPRPSRTDRAPPPFWLGQAAGGVVTAPDARDSASLDSIGSLMRGKGWANRGCKCRRERSL